MNVVETPFFVLTLGDVEIACFERVMVINGGLLVTRNNSLELNLLI